MQLVSVISRATLGAAIAVLALGVAAAYEDDILFERDTPYIPSPPEVVERMLDLANVRPGEIVIDLGSGDGRIADRRGAARSPRLRRRPQARVGGGRAMSTLPKPASPAAPPLRCRTCSRPTSARPTC